MRIAPIVWLLRLTLLIASARVAAEEVPTHWGVDMGVEFNNVLTQSTDNKPYLGFYKFSGFFSVGKEVSVDLSSGLLLTKQGDQITTASNTYVLAGVEGYVMPSEAQHYGLAVQGEFSLEGVQPVFNERRILIGPAAKFGLDSIGEHSIKLRIAAGYVGAWQPSVFNNGFAVVVTGQYMQ